MRVTKGIQTQEKTMVEVPSARSTSSFDLNDPRKCSIQIIKFMVTDSLTSGQVTKIEDSVIFW